MFFTKLKNFIVQCLLLPISFLINMCSVGPIVLVISLLTEGEKLANLSMTIISVVVMLPLALGLSKLLVRIKGKQTDDYATSLVWRQDEVTTQFTYDGEVIAESKYTTPEYLSRETSHWLTGWGIFAVITSVIAFPLRLIAVIVAFVGLFVSEIYTTHRPLPDDSGIGTGNRILHTLFDFIILPSHAERGESSPLAFAFMGGDIILCVLTFFINMLVSSDAGDSGIWTLLLAFVMLIPVLILLIRDTVKLYRNYDLRTGIINSVKLLCISLIPTLIAVILMIFGI